ncbi:hypothetical protein [Ammoniphilus sp. CFH 90114]|uniref:hypothetical protein n=1 Tax=Ammoniphilus sp. CFH 90114 TaxID=2493665 RepID=UPI00100F514F|nr:hypothetical protein [Ammoniphilus sp. CFH 90114]RXT08834.1 hypothetical protein EIZ39_08520 [Ammoniphilus sp. CFH 90114]
MYREKYRAMACEEVMAELGITAVVTDQHRVMKEILDNFIMISESLYITSARNKWLLVHSAGFVFSGFHRYGNISKVGDDVLLRYRDLVKVMYCGRTGIVNTSMENVQLEKGHKDGYPIVWFSKEYPYLPGGKPVYLKAHLIILAIREGYETLKAIGTDRTHDAHHIRGVENGNALEDIELLDRRAHSVLPKRR